MKAVEKSQFTHISKIPIFNDVFSKIVLGEELLDNEKTYILSVALLALKKYENDNSLKSYLEFAYYIILNYSITYEDYKPLYDFSVEYGFFPIVKEILDKNLIEVNIKEIFTKVALDRFDNDKYIETLQQHNIKKSIDITEKELAFIAPTSFGKSEFIIEHINLVKNNKNKLAIIVPSKSLLVQTYNLVKTNFKEYKIIYHDEMFDKEEKFIAVLTQERALKILDDESVYFDVVYIDEAHNLFKRDSRSILLTRLLRLNMNRNPETQVMYFSPLIEETNNLKLFDGQNIVEKKIDVNIKHPVFYYKNETNESIYNRYSNGFYKVTEDSSSYIDYITRTALKKNFIYIRNPKDIEEFALELINKLPDISLDEESEKLVNGLTNQIHSEYWMIKLIKKGVIYLHGKLPDIIKEYLEYCFKNNQSLRYMVANHVVLEGVNLPIDNMYILQVYSLKIKDAVNLIGRVNRLNYIFSGEDNNLKKLIPKIYFVESKFKGADIENYIKRLRSNIFDDQINNPLLVDYENENLPEDIKIKDEEIRFIEDFIINDYDEEKNELLKVLFKNNIHQYIQITDSYISILNERIKRINIHGKDVLDIIYNLFFDYTQLFVKNDEMFYFKNYEFVRNNYKLFVNKLKTMTLKKYINTELRYYNRLNNKIVYIGKSFGNVDKNGNISDIYRDNKYVNLAGKDTSQIINFILVKYKLDNDFINYHLNNFVDVLYDLDILNDSHFNQYHYGTENENVISLQRLGVSRSLINKIVSDLKIDLFQFDEKNNLIETNELKSYINQLNEIEKFEIYKYI